MSENSREEIGQPSNLLSFARPVRTEAAEPPIIAPGANERGHSAEFSSPSEPVGASARPAHVARQARAKSGYSSRRRGN